MPENKQGGQGGPGQGQAGERKGMRYAYYDLISVEYHALQGVETSAQYVMDAEEEGNKELARYFEKTQEQYRQIAEEGKRFLSQKGEMK